MQKLLNKKLFVRWLSIFLAVVLTITLAPSMPFAYGDNETDATEKTLVVTEETEDTTLEGEELDDPNSEDESGSGEDENGLGDETLAAGLAVASIDPRDPVNYNNKSTELTADLATKSLDLKQMIVFNDRNEHTIVVPSGKTLTATILVQNGTTLHIEGDGAISGYGDTGSVINVEGGNSALTLNRDSNKGTNITITNGKGTVSNWNSQIFTNATKSGGGILIQRDSGGTGASLEIFNGTITSNEAGAGGGIYVDRGCKFTMHNGSITNNTAKSHEGGGLYIASSVGAEILKVKDGNDYNPGATIKKGTIDGNETSTTTDWGGGGIFIESEGSLTVGAGTNGGTILVTSNTANGLGGGISGCPHAKLGLGDITEGAAIYGNTANKTYKDYDKNEYLPNNKYLRDLNTDAYGHIGDIVAYELDKEKFTKDKAMDFYCTRASVVYGATTTWTGRAAYYNALPNGDHGVDLTVSEGDVLRIAGGSLGLTADPLSLSDQAKASFDVKVTNNTSNTHGGGIGCNGTLIIGDLDRSESTTNSVSLDFTKQFKNLNGDTVALPEGMQFTFGLYKTANESDPVTDSEGNPITATSDASGNITFDFKVDRTGSHTYFVKEIVPSENDKSEFVEYDSAWRQVDFTVDSKTVTITDAPLQSTSQIYFIVKDSVRNFIQNENGKFIQTTIEDGKSGSTFVNKAASKGYFSLAIDKNYYGTAAASGKFNFTMTEIPAVENSLYDPNNMLADAQSFTATNGDFTNNTAKVTFSNTGDPYTTAGDHWYVITEGESSLEGTINDPRVYVVKIHVGVATDGMSLASSVAEAYYAKSSETNDQGQIQLTKLNVNPSETTQNGTTAITLPEVKFNNFDENAATVTLSGYSVYAASNEPLDQKCFVDPKIIKKLDGRELKEGEFNFRFIEITPEADGTVDWSKQVGKEISATSNDRFGMVDFDKANNVGDDPNNPTCLSYLPSEAGMHYYRVVEANTTTDPSVDYSKEIITFTTEIVVDQYTGQLECKDMYYGHVEDGENVRYDESKDPAWHPTMTNYARGMDLQVRKTSALDRDNGLEGATYGLYAVNNADQGDIFLGESTSDADGWITFKNVSLTQGTLYYFKETAAPAGHTVSEFRSSYFYLVKDVSAPNGYTIAYTDNKNELGEKADEEEISLVAASLTPFALDDETTEGSSIPDRSDDGNMLFTFALDGGVYDEATLVEFAKLDTRTHEWVEGADLSIIEKSSGKVVNSWTSGKATERLEGKLNVDTTYILRENNAPEGYAKANDVEFTIDSYGNVSILSGTSNGNAEIQDSTITLYDTMLDGEEVLTEYRENVREVPGDEGDTIVKTSDLFKFGGIALLLAGAIALVLFAKRRANKATAQEGSVAANPTKRRK